ncbi:MAG: FecR domain-containing protein [Puia sp.]|nr:FecR domain-containing protein [Puia sp.]
MDEPFEIDPILSKYIREEPLTVAEEAVLHEWIADGEDRASMIERFRNDPTWTRNQLLHLEEIGHLHIWKKLEGRLQSEGVWVDRETTEETPVTPMLNSTRSRWWLYGLVGCVLVAVASVVYLLRVHQAPAAVAVAPPIPGDVQPGSNKATLTLTDGHVVTLDSAADGVITHQGIAQVDKRNGTLTYRAVASEKPAAPSFNVLATPRAGQFALFLPDGTHIWLNNASSIRYPVSFTGDSRDVELTGEAYFEVARDVAHPFRVHIRNSPAGAEGGTIEVLGTSFNAMAYADEDAERATLVEGTVRYGYGGSSTLLKPAEEAVLPKNGALKTLHHVNVEEITAWKNGYFHFDHASLETTMRQLARWYDVSVVYQGKIDPQEFMGKIQRTMPLSSVLKGLEGEHVHFLVAGKQVTVTP